MRKIGLKLLQFYLKVAATAFLWRYKPVIIGVTGTVGKSSTKEAIYTVLKDKFSARRNVGSYNNEIGVPLTILGEESPGSNIWGWLGLIFKVKLKFVYNKNYPKILVLELGVDKPKDLEYLLSFIKPEISVITSIGAAHLEQLKSEVEVFKEKAKLVWALPKKGTAILSFDDKRLRELGVDLKCKVIFYGLSGQANMHATDIKYSDSKMTFNINWEGSLVPAEINAFGKPQVYSALAASAVAVALGQDLISVTRELKKIKALKGRLKLFLGKKETKILDDSYNSNPLSARASLETATKIKESIGAKRLVVVLGDMLELGTISRRAHLNLGREAKTKAEVVVAVGKEAKNIAKGAREIHPHTKNFGEGVKDENVYWYENSETAATKILPLLRESDLVLIKGSQGVRMEKISKVLLKNKSDIKHLPRMSGYWINK